MEYRGAFGSPSVDIGSQTLRHELFSIGRTLGIEDDEIEERCSDIMRYAMFCTALYYVEESIDKRATYLKHQFLSSCMPKEIPLNLQTSRCLKLPDISRNDYDSSEICSYDSERILSLLKAVAVASNDASISKLDTLIFAAEKKERILSRCPIITHLIPSVPYVPESWEARCQKMRILSSTNLNKSKHLFGPKHSIGSSKRLKTPVHTYRNVCGYHKDWCTLDGAICSILDTLSLEKGRNAPFEKILRRKVLESGLSIHQASSIIYRASCLAWDRIRYGCWRLSKELEEDYGKLPFSRPALLSNVFSDIISRDVYSPLNYYYNYRSRSESDVQKRMHTIHTIHPLLWQSCKNCEFLESTVQVFMNQCIELHRYIWYIP